MVESSLNGLPTFPLEILDQIVGLHSDPGKTRHSPTLLALHSTSREFRACALRYICEYVSIGCGKPHKPNDRLHGVLHPSHINSRLGGIAPYIKSLDISLNIGNCRLQERSSSGVHIVDIEALRTISDESSLRGLRLDGGSWIGSLFFPSLVWRHVPEKIRVTLEGLLQLPTLEELQIGPVSGLPENLLEYVCAQEVELRECSFSGPRFVRPSTRGESSAITNISVIRSCVPADTAFPNLRRITGNGLLADQFDVMWRIIFSARQTLKVLEIYGTHCTYFR